MLEVRRLVAVGRLLLWLTPLLFFGMVAFNIVTVRLGYSTLPQLANIRAQLRKLEAAERVDTVFFGDSSLGRLIDRETWQAVFGETSLALPLTGGEGYVGDLYLLQQVLKRDRPRRVVLVHTADMLTRNIAWSAYFVIRPDAPSIDPPFERWLRDQIKAYMSAELLVASLEGGVTRLLDRSLPLLADGFVDPAPALVPHRFDPKAPIVFDAADINLEKTLFFDLVAELCAREGLDCRYAFGPLWDAVCESSQPYLAAARAVIEARGMPVVDGTPICVPLEHLDDSEDHIVREKRAWYTAEFHARLEAFEAQRRAPAGRAEAR